MDKYSRAETESLLESIASRPNRLLGLREETFVENLIRKTEEKKILDAIFQEGIEE